MPIGGYDPDDLDEELSELMGDRDPSNWLTEAEVREYERGESLVDLLDEDDIRELLRRKDGDATPD